jgi:hypothetical protein
MDKQQGVVLVMLKKTERAINNGQIRDNGNIGWKTQNEVEQNKKTCTIN